jgi:hypothetical protein
MRLDFEQLALLLEGEVLGVVPEPADPSAPGVWRFDGKVFLQSVSL